MKALVKVFIAVFLFFLLLFVIFKFTGILSVDNIKLWLTQAKDISPIYVASTVILLLVADLLITIPTLVVTILAGYFLGHFYGAAAALTGIMLTGTLGYALSYRYGEVVLNALIKDVAQRQEASAIFQRHGFPVIVLSRAVPMLPEASACLAGMTRMPFKQFITAWLLSAAPYCLIVAFAGSVSSLENPIPAIFTALGFSGFLWVAWFFYHRAHRLT